MAYLPAEQNGQQERTDFETDRFEKGAQVAYVGQTRFRERKHQYPQPDQEQESIKAVGANTNANTIVTIPPRLVIG